MRAPIFAALTAVFLSSPLFAEGIVVIDPYARAASPSAKAGAAFMVLKNESGTDDILLSAHTDAAERVELHTHVESGDGVLQMTRLQGGLTIADGQSIHLKRGGDHVMLMGLTGPLKQDADIQVTLVFENAGEVVVSVPIDNARKPNAGHKAHGDHSGHTSHDDHSKHSH